MALTDADREQLRRLYPVKTAREEQIICPCGKSAHPAFGGYMCEDCFAIMYHNNHPGAGMGSKGDYRSGGQRWVNGVME